MSNVIDIKCTQCKKLNIRRYGWIDPGKFKDPKNAQLTSSFHCAFCSYGNAVKIQYLPKGEMEITEQLDFKALIKDDPMPFYIGGPGHDEPASPEVLSEGAALSLLNDTDD